MLSEEVKRLEELYNDALESCRKLALEKEKLKRKIEKMEEIQNMIIPNKVYRHKKRRNTTVKFLDGSQQTVTRRRGEQDCIETAIAYCVLKQLMPASDLRKLIEDMEEH